LYTLREKKMAKTSIMKPGLLVTGLLWICGIIIIAMTIPSAILAQIPTVQHYQYVILILIVFMGVISLANCYLSKGVKDNYRVNNVERGVAGGKENKAYENEAEKKTNNQTDAQDPSKTNGAPGTDQKWVSNYVPYGDYPKGNIVYVKEDEVN